MLASLAILRCAGLNLAAAAEQLLAWRRQAAVQERGQLFEVLPLAHASACPLDCGCQPAAAAVRGGTAADSQDPASMQPREGLWLLHADASLLREPGTPEQCTLLLRARGGTGSA